MYSNYFMHQRPKPLFIKLIMFTTLCCCEQWDCVLSQDFGVRLSSSVLNFLAKCVLMFLIKVRMITSLFVMFHLLQCGSTFCQTSKAHTTNSTSQCYVLTVGGLMRGIAWILSIVSEYGRVGYRSITAGHTESWFIQT